MVEKHPKKKKKNGRYSKTINYSKLESYNYAKKWLEDAKGKRHQFLGFQLGNMFTLSKKEIKDFFLK